MMSDADAVTHPEPTAATEPRRLLLVEDDPALALGLRDTMEFEGFRVIHTKRGTAAVEMVRSLQPDIIVLDLMLPDINGYEVCRQVREFSVSTPIIMLTARSQETDKIRGFDVGADDYLTKPFSVAELVARVHALLRRSTPQLVTRPFDLGLVRVHPHKHLLVRGDETFHLSHHEMGVLVTLNDAQGSPVSRENLLQSVWKNEHPSARTIDNIILKLRRWVEEDPADPKNILTVYGVGYKLAKQD